MTFIRVFITWGVTLDHHLGNSGYARKHRKWKQEDGRLA
jgi:hypothetical protein